LQHENEIIRLKRELDDTVKESGMKRMPSRIISVSKEVLEYNSKDESTVIKGIIKAGKENRISILPFVGHALYMCVLFAINNFQSTEEAVRFGLCAMEEIRTVTFSRVISEYLEDQYDQNMYWFSNTIYFLGAIKEDLTSSIHQLPSVIQAMTPVFDEALKLLNEIKSNIMKITFTVITQNLIVQAFTEGVSKNYFKTLRATNNKSGIENVLSVLQTLKERSEIFNIGFELQVQFIEEVSLYIDHTLMNYIIAKKAGASSLAAIKTNLTHIDGWSEDSKFKEKLQRRKIDRTIQFLEALPAKFTLDDPVHPILSTVEYLNEHQFTKLLKNYREKLPKTVITSIVNHFKEKICKNLEEEEHSEAASVREVEIPKASYEKVHLPSYCHIPNVKRRLIANE
jgi:hypothetical protein